MGLVCERRGWSVSDEVVAPPLMEAQRSTSSPPLATKQALPLDRAEREDDLGEAHCAKGKETGDLHEIILLVRQRGKEEKNRQASGAKGFLSNGGRDWHSS